METICYPMEVWQEEMWPVVVPGKHKFVGRQRWMEALLEAVEVYGRGNVMSQFVGGCELAASRCHRCNGLATHYDFQRLMGRKERLDQAA